MLILLPDFRLKEYSVILHLDSVSFTLLLIHIVAINGDIRACGNLCAAWCVQFKCEVHPPFQSHGEQSSSEWFGLKQDASQIQRKKILYQTK